MSNKPAPRATGRPTKFCHELVEEICKHLGDGVPMDYAAALCGVSGESVRNWRTKYPRFDQSVCEAIARGVQSRLAVIKKAAESDWRAASWWLEHVLPERFARNRLEVTGADGAPLSAGVQLYLPQKQALPAVEAGGPAEMLALPEGRANGNGE